MQDDALVPNGAAFFAAQDTQTRAFAFYLVPGFTLLAFSSAVEPLRIANQLSQRPLYHWRVLSEKGGPVVSSAGIEIGTEPMPASLSRNIRLFVCAGGRPSEAMKPGPVGAIGRHARHGGAVGGICTGAFALAKAGLLRDRDFTLHWENQPGFAETFPDLTPSDRLFEVSDSVTTCGGGAAATDMGLAMIAQDHGAAFSAMVSEMCLRRVMVGEDMQQRSANAVLIQSRNPVLLEIVGLMNAHLQDPLTLEALALRVGYSRRQVERLFATVIGQTPGQYYRNLRLDRARVLLSTTNLGLHEVAAAVGFNALGHFSKAFRQRFGHPPSAVHAAPLHQRKGAAQP